jgi:tetratricopeptide (TPR) repeat protein
MTPARKRHAPPATPAADAWFRPNAPAGSAMAPDRALMIAAAVVIVAFAVVALAIALGPHRIGDIMTETDFYGAYAQGAADIQRGKFDAGRYSVVGPGYEVALALVGFVIRDLFLAAELLSVASSVAILVLWFLLLRVRAGAGLGLMAIVFIAANAHFLRHAYSATTDALAIALQAAGLFLLLGRDPATSLPIARAALAGGLIGLAFLTRYNGAVLLPAGLAAIALGGVGSQNRWRIAIAFTAGFLAPVVPWMIWSATHGGATGFQFHHNIAYDVFARARGIPWDDYQRDLQSQFPTLAHVIARDPGAVFSRMIFNVWDHLRQDATSLLTVPVALCAGIGLVLAVVDGILRRVWPMLLTGALLFLTLVPVFYSERYSLAILPVYAMLAGWAFASPRFALALRSPRVWLKPLLVALPLATALAASQKVQARVMDQLPVETLEVADSLRRYAQPGDKIIARKGHISWLAGLEPAGFPFVDSLEVLARYTQDNDIRWIYFSWPEAETRPRVSWLLDTAAVVPGLTVRASTRPHPAVLYEVGPEFGARPAWLDNDSLVAYHKLRSRLLVHGNDFEALNNLAILSRMLGRIDESRRCLEKLVTMVPNNASVWLMMGEVLLSSDQPEPAGRAFQRARALDPRNPMATIGIGWSQLLIGREQEAATTWRPVISATNDPYTLGRMGELYTQLGDRDAEFAVRTQLAAVGARP